MLHRLCPPLSCTLTFAGRKLYKATQACDLAAMVELLDAGVDVNWTNEKGQTALFCSAEYMVENMTEHYKATQLLLSRGANTEVADDDGCTPAWIAAYYGHNTSLKVLMDAGADMNAVNKAGHNVQWAATLLTGQTLGHVKCKDMLKSAQAA